MSIRHLEKLNHVLDAQSMVVIRYFCCFNLKWLLAHYQIILIFNWN